MGARPSPENTHIKRGHGGCPDLGVCFLEMAVPYFRGVKVLTCGRRAAIRHGSQRLPQRGDRFFYLALSRVWLFLRWRAHRGYIMCALCSARDPEHGVIERWSYGDEKMPIKRRAMGADLPPIPALSIETVLLKKCSMLVEFCSATAYEDGAARTPGYFTFRNRTIEYELTVYDPDAGMRISCCAPDLDRVFAGMEALLKAPDAPWMVDRYLWERKPKEKRKKS